MESPCLQCTRVRDPKNCEAKTCKDWQAWFIDRWESMRENVRKEMEKASLTGTGVPLGGQHYVSPHRVREYLEKDPCCSCLCPKDVCHTPCPLKSAWLEGQKGENL